MLFLKSVAVFLLADNIIVLVQRKHMFSDFLSGSYEGSARLDLANSSCLSIFSPCFCWTKQISQWSLNNVHLKRQPETGREEKRQGAQSAESESGR